MGIKSIFKKIMKRDTYDSSEKDVFESPVELEGYRYREEISPQEIKAIQKKTKEHINDRIDVYLGKMQQSPNRPKRMAYFDDTAHLYDNQRLKEIRAHKKRGGKVIGTFCMFPPQELIYAAGAIPIRLCSGEHGTISTGEEILADPGLCPLVKSSLGGIIGKASPYFELCDVVVLPMVCDAKMKMGEVLADFIPVWTLNVPHIKHTTQAKELWLEEMKDLKKKIEKLTGNPIYWQELKDSIEMFLKMQTTFRRFYDLRKADRPTITGRDALMVSQFPAFFDDVSRCTKKTTELSDELEKRIEKGICVTDPDAPRILLAGAPIIRPNWKIPQIIEEAGGIIVCDELCSGTRALYDPIGVDEWNWDDMFRALAEKYLQPCACPCFTPNDERIGRIVQMIEDYNVQGVFYHILRGCHIYNIESTRIKRLLDQKKIPMLIIETEYSEEDIEQIRTRVEAFLMLVRARRGRR